MVKSKMGLPEPPDLELETTLSLNNFNTLQADSDVSDAEGELEDSPYDGYERLPVRIVSDSDPEWEEPTDEQEQTDSSFPTITSMEEIIVKEVWSNPSDKDIEMGLEKIREIKEALENFSLPSTSFPEWTNDVPEEEWKEHIMTLIKNK